MRKDDMTARHFQDLSRRARQKGIVLYTDFLDQMEQSLLHESVKEDASLSVRLFGGYSHAERKVAAFLPDDDFATDEADYPVSCLLVSPKSPRYAEGFTHRDLLGALMNLGVERRLLGDLLFSDEIHILCVTHIAGLICDCLHQVRHTDVLLREVPLLGLSYQPSFREETVSIASNRIDAFLSAACHISRQEALRRLDGEKVFVNQRIVKSHKAALLEGDIVSIRGTGKLEFLGAAGETRKGKTRVKFRWYV